MELGCVVTYCPTWNDNKDPVNPSRCLSTALSCPLVDKDDARDSLEALLQPPLSQGTQHASIEPPQATGLVADRPCGGESAASTAVGADTLNRLSYDIMWEEGEDWAEGLGVQRVGFSPGVREP